MSSTYTPNLGQRKPEHKDPDTYDSWDIVLNGNADIIDAAFGARSYSAAAQHYILNSDSHSLSLNKIAEALYNVFDPVKPTTDQKAALAGPGGYTPSGSNPYVPVNYVRISKKDVLYPEFVGATFSPTPGGANVGNFTSDSEIITLGGLGYRFNYYDWSSSEVTLQNYDIVLQWRVPDTFVNFIASKALILDIRTDSATPTDCHVDIELHKDGTDPATISTLSDKVSPDGTWRSIRLGNEVISFDATDPILAALTAGSLLNIRITMNSLDDWHVAIGPVTISYVG